MTRPDLRPDRHPPGVSTRSANSPRTGSPFMPPWHPGPGRRAPTAEACNRWRR